jgi:hypothetical protein
MPRCNFAVHPDWATGPWLSNATVHAWSLVGPTSHSMDVVPQQYCVVLGWLSCRVVRGALTFLTFREGFYTALELRRSQSVAFTTAVATTSLVMK